MGSCMMAAAFHYRNNDGSKHTIKQAKFAAYGCPCAYMRHDKVFIIPERLGQFVTKNPNKVPTPADSYIGLPLIADGKNIGHYGLMWSAQSNAQRQHSWAFTELLLSTMEDMILQRLLEGSNFLKMPPIPDRHSSIIPHDAVSSTQSLRPYAGSLSHELRTPMQGIVGMLDVIYMNVEEAKEHADTPSQRQKLDVVKQNIEVVQDSSRRAIEAADNVVHAYDMDMSLPAAPQLPLDEFDSLSPIPTRESDRRPHIVVAGSDLPLNRPNKRRWDEAFSRQSSLSSATKLPRVEDAHDVWTLGTEPSRGVVEGVHEAENVQSRVHPDATLDDAPTLEDAVLAKAAMDSGSRIIAPGLRHTSMREVFYGVISEGLKMGGRPDAAVVQETETGEIIEVRSRGSDGTTKTKLVEWSVDPAMPHTLFVDEKDLSKLVSCVFLNAIKFTDQDGGRVQVRARLSSRGKYISIKVLDNGPGIPAAFLPNLFKPFSRENASITRPSEGLGLGLMVAKGIARKLGGDLMCTRAETDGLGHGSDFEIKIPLMAGETITRPSSPFISPVPRFATPYLDTPVARTPPSPPPTSNDMSSPAKLAHTLDDFTGHDSTRHDDLTSSTPSPKSQPFGPCHEPRAPSVTVTSSPPSPPASRPLEKRNPRVRKSVSNPQVDRNLAAKYPLNFLVAEDNKINRSLLVSMLKKMGYKNIVEAHDGTEAVRQMSVARAPHEAVDMILMDLWMPLMDGYEATQRILARHREGAEGAGACPTVLAVTADVTDDAQARVAEVGMKGFLSKPYKMHDLQRLIAEYCANHHERNGDGMEMGG